MQVEAHVVSLLHDLLSSLSLTVVYGLV